jgi:hypothetical protein
MAECHYSRTMRKTTPLVREHEKFVVRLPDGMRDRIAASAKENSRSMNAEIVTRLELSFDPSSYPMELRKAALLNATEFLKEYGIPTLANAIAEKITEKIQAQSDRELVAEKIKGSVAAQWDIP